MIKLYIPTFIVIIILVSLVNHALTEEMETSIWTYEFSNSDPTSDNIIVTAPGIEMGQFQSGISIPSDGETSLTDGIGAQITVTKDQGVILFFPAQNTDPSGAIVRLSVYASGPGAQLALAAMDADRTLGLQSIDGSMAARIISNSDNLQNKWHQLSIFLDPYQNGIVPIVQFLSSANDDVFIYIDNLEIINPSNNVTDELYDKGNTIYKTTSIQKPGDITSSNFDRGLSENWKLNEGSTLYQSKYSGFIKMNGTSQANWDVICSGNVRLDFQYAFDSGTASVKFKESITSLGVTSYLLRIEPKMIQLFHENDDNFRLLKSADINLSTKNWHDISIWIENIRILVILNGKIIMDVKDEDSAIQSGSISFETKNAENILIDNVTLYSIPEDYISRYFDSLRDTNMNIYDKLYIEEPWIVDIGELIKTSIVPLKIVTHIRNEVKYPIIDPGNIPPNFSHSWMVDIMNLNSFKLYFYPDEIQLDWQSGDRLILLDERKDNSLIINSLEELENSIFTVSSNDFNIQKSILIDENDEVLETGPYARFYMILETSEKRVDRSLKIRGLLNTNTNKGYEEAILVGDDLNYFVSSYPNDIDTEEDLTNLQTYEYFFVTYDPTTNKYKRIIQPWDPQNERPALPDNNKLNDTPQFPKCLSINPQHDDGWYLLGKTIYNDPEEEDASSLIYSIAYYNEQTSKLRVYLFNRSYYQDLNQNGILVYLSLLGHTDDGESSSFDSTSSSSNTILTNLKGAFFNFDPRPTNWNHVKIYLPYFPSGKWVFVEVPVFYPMAKNYPIDLSKSENINILKSDPLYASNITDTTSFYQPIYENKYIDSIKEAKRNVLLRVIVQGYRKTDINATFEAWGQAIDMAAGGTSLFKTATEIAQDTLSYFKSGANAWEYAHNYEKRKEDFGDTIAGFMFDCTKLPKSIWGAGISIVGLGLNIYDKIFGYSNTPLALEISLNGNIQGSGVEKLGYLEHRYYLPGRFSIIDAIFGEGWKFNSYERERNERYFSFYDRTIGHFGYRYDPSSIHMNVLRYDYKGDPGVISIFDSGMWKEEITDILIPANENISDNITTDELQINAMPPKIEKLLPVIYNQYTDIIPMIPTEYKKVNAIPADLTTAYESWKNEKELINYNTIYDTKVYDSFLEMLHIYGLFKSK